MVLRHHIATPLSSPGLVRLETAPGLTDYAFAVARMETEVAAIANGTMPELLWLVEHPALYTAGTSAKASDLVDPDRFPVHLTGRGGQYTYHGPGQRVAYVMVDLHKRGNDVRAFVAALERAIIATLAHFGLKGETREDRVGVWVSKLDRDSKIAAIGIRVRRGITFHGLAINVAPDLSHYDGIVPCGVVEHSVTSLQDLGIQVSMGDVDKALVAAFEHEFGGFIK